MLFRSSDSNNTSDNDLSDTSNEYDDSSDDESGSGKHSLDSNHSSNSTHSTQLQTMLPNPFNKVPPTFDTRSDTRGEDNHSRSERDYSRSERDYSRSERDYSRSERDYSRSERDYSRSERDNEASNYYQGRREQREQREYHAYPKERGYHQPREYQRGRNEYPRGSDMGGPEMMREQQQHLPSLSELNMNDKHIPNISYASHNRDEENKKRELLFKFDLLRKKYKDASIPEFNMMTPYEEMNRGYEMAVRNLVIESSSESYKTYLIGGFLAMEAVLGGWLGFDMVGFTQQQIMSMSTYERLLIELGEKSYVDEES